MLLRCSIAVHSHANMVLKPWPRWASKSLSTCAEIAAPNARKSTVWVCNTFPCIGSAHFLRTRLPLQLIQSKSKGRTYKSLWYAAGFVTLFLFVPHLIRSQDKAIPSAASSSASSTSAPTEQANALAARLADAIAQSKNGTVLVFNFVGPDRRLGPLGAVLADDLSTHLRQRLKDSTFKITR